MATTTPAGGRVAGLVWLVAALATGAAEVWAILRSTAPYSVVRQAISDLGQTTCEPVTTYPAGPVEVCSPGHDLLNWVWIVTGVLIAAAAIVLRRRLGRGAGATVTTVLVVLGGLGQAGSGLVPTDRDLLLHAVVAGLGILAQNAALIAAGITLRRAGRAELGAFSLVAGVVGTVATALIVAPTRWGLPFGVIERISVHPFLVWLAVVGALLVAGRTPVTDSTRPARVTGAA